MNNDNKDILIVIVSEGGIVQGVWGPPGMRSILIDWDCTDEGDPAERIDYIEAKLTELNLTVFPDLYDGADVFDFDDVVTTLQARLETEQDEQRSRRDFFTAR